MNRQELKNFIIDNNCISYNRTQIYIKPSKLKHILSFIEKETYLCRDDLSERIYWIMNDIEKYPICLYCGKEYKPRFHGFKNGYRERQYCSQYCVNNSEIYKKNKQDSVKEKYGSEFVSQSNVFKQKVIQNNLEKYGVEHYFQSQEFKNKFIDTNMERYKVPNPMQNELIFERNNKCKTKKLQLPSGKIINYQGYENIAIFQLLQTINEKDLITERKLIPKINYKNKIYFPDIYIPKDNLIIEVKSEWTYERYKEINMLKAKATIESGYNFQFWICDKNQVLEKIILN